MTTTISRSPRGLLSGVVDSTAHRLAYILGGLPLAAGAFVAVVTGFALGVSTALVWVGVPVLAATLWAARGMALVERRSTERVTGRGLPPHHYRVALPGAGRPGQSLAMVRDPQAWRDLLHAVLGFPVRIVSGVLALAWTIVGVGGLLYVTWEWALPGDRRGLYRLTTGHESHGGDVLLTTVIGAIALLALPWSVQGLTALRVGLARGLLTNQTAALRAATATLAASRRAAAAAETATLRRLERDMHDGPQQRLVRIAMDLEATSRRLDDDPERARPLLAEAITQSREVLEELRALSRGMAPPLLTERGLAAALEAVAARSPVPAALDTALPAELSHLAQSTAYFVVAEALTNVAKHACASRVRITATVEGDRLLVTVDDDGRGGAHVGRGHGLAGLTDRVAATGGSLRITSPPGGPTTLTATIPAALT